MVHAVKAEAPQLALGGGDDGAVLLMTNSFMESFLLIHKFYFCLLYNIPREVSQGISVKSPEKYASKPVGACWHIV